MKGSIIAWTMDRGENMQAGKWFTVAVIAFLLGAC
jgi:hypothetical protein